MKRLTLLFTLVMLALSASTAYAQMTPVQMTEEWQRAKLYTKEYLEAMPADGYAFKPTPEMRSFAAQMLHLANGNYGLSSAATGKPNPLGEKSLEQTIPQNKEATIKAVLESYDYVIAIIQDMTIAQMNEKIKFANKELTRGIVLSKAFEHQTHHRGQTTVYLRLKGVTPPGERLF